MRWNIWLKTKYGAIYQVVGRKNGQWLVQKQPYHNSNFIVDLKEPDHPFPIDKNQIAAIGPNYQKVCKAKFNFEAYMIRWTKKEKGIPRQIAISYHKNLAEALAFKHRKVKSNPDLSPEPEIPCKVITSEEICNQTENETNVWLPIPIRYY